MLEQEGIECEVIDPRTIAPLDTDTVVASVARTGRLACVQESPAAGSWGQAVVSPSASPGASSCSTPRRSWSRPTPMPVPYAKPLEDAALPGVERIAAELRAARRRRERPAHHRGDRDHPHPRAARRGSTAAAPTTMTHRATVLVRVLTDGRRRRRGLRGRRGRGAGRDRRRRPRRDRARADRPGLLRRRALLGARATRPRSTSCATAASASWRWRRRRCALWDAVGKALGQPLWRLWGGYRDTVPMIAIGGYYDSQQTIADEIAGLPRDGPGRLQVQGRRRSPERGRRARRTRRARAAGDDFVLDDRRQPGLRRRRRRSTCAGGVDGLGIRWFEEPCRWHNDRRDLRDVRLRSAACPSAPGRASSRVSGCRDLMEAGAIDVCNFDSSWSGGPTAWRRVRRGRRTPTTSRWRHHEEPQVAAAPARQPARTAPTPSASTPTATRSGGTWSPTAPIPSRRGVQLPHGPGLGWELDRDYIEFHRIDR